MKKEYTTDLSLTEWQFISKYFNSQRKPKWAYKLMFEAVLYVTKNGCSWRDLPSNFPPWQTVYWYFRHWSSEGLIELVINELNILVRKKSGRFDSPSALIIDSQTVKNTAYSTKQVGIDGGKKIKGRKRHIVTDTMGNLMAVKVHTAQIHDSKAAKLVLIEVYKNRVNFPRIKVLFADKGYRGNLSNWVKNHLKIQLEVVKTYTKPSNNGKMMVSPKRWIVERSFAWLNHYRRLSKDFERLTHVAESFIKIAFINLALRKL